MELRGRRKLTVSSRWLVGKRIEPGREMAFPLGHKVMVAAAENGGQVSRPDQSDCAENADGPSLRAPTMCSKRPTLIIGGVHKLFDNHGGGSRHHFGSGDIAAQLPRIEEPQRNEPNANPRSHVRVAGGRVSLGNKPARPNCPGSWRPIWSATQ